jgi:hypothetical protein
VRYAEYGYTANGPRQSVKDAIENLSTLIYDGHDRLRELRENGAVSGVAREYGAGCGPWVRDATAATSRAVRHDGAQGH